MGATTPVEPTIVLPWPPSVNNYWRTVIRHGRPTVLLTDVAEKYRVEVQAIVLQRYGFITPARARLRVSIMAIMPDRKRRDLDNLHKAVLDALTHARVWEDDSQIDDLRITRGPVRPPGALEVTIWKIPTAQKALALEGGS